MELSNTLQCVKERVAGDKRFWLIILAVACLSSLLPLSPEQRLVALPILFIANVAVFFVAGLWGRGDEEPVPLFELGTLYCAALTVYSLVPFLNYLLAGMVCTGLSDNRLFSDSVTPEEIGRFAWNYVVYFSIFAAAYLWMRGRGESRKRVAVITDRPSPVIIALPLVALMAYFYVLNVVWGVNATPDYSKINTNLLSLERDSLLAAQVSGHLRGILLILKMGLLILLFERRGSQRWRVVLCLWLMLETTYTILNRGARLEPMLLLMCALLLYHRLIKPIRLSQAMLVGLLLLAGFQLAGMTRDYFNDGYRREFRITFQTLASINNEFQSNFATAYDLDRLKRAGRLEDIPAQLYVSDLLMPVPRQMLPITKIDPSIWYRDIKGYNKNTGYMFGVISQSVIGFGLLEPALRGALIGIHFAWAHRWHLSRSSGFLPTLVYAWLCVWSYYTFRASTFYLLAPIIYQLPPAVAFIYFSTRLLRGRMRRVADQGRPAL